MLPAATLPAGYIGSLSVLQTIVKVAEKLRQYQPDLVYGERQYWQDILLASSCSTKWLCCGALKRTACSSPCPCSLLACYTVGSAWSTCAVRLQHSRGRRLGPCLRVAPAPTRPFLLPLARPPLPASTRRCLLSLPATDPPLPAHNPPAPFLDLPAPGPLPAAPAQCATP